MFHGDNVLMRNVRTYLDIPDADRAVQDPGPDHEMCSGLTSGL